MAIMPSPPNTALLIGLSVSHLLSLHITNFDCSSIFGIAQCHQYPPWYALEIVLAS